MTTITTKWIGDRWKLTVAFKDVSGAAVVLDPVSAIPGGNLFLATNKVPYALTVAAADITITDAANGIADYYVHSSRYTTEKFLSTDPVFNRLQAFITDATGEHITFAVADLPVLDPRTADLSKLPAPTTTIVGFQVGPQGPAGPPSNAVTTVIPFPNPQTPWTINHGLGRRPSVTLVDTANDMMLADITYVNDNSILVQFAVPVAGTAYLN